MRTRYSFLTSFFSPCSCQNRCLRFDRIDPRRVHHSGSIDRRSHTSDAQASQYKRPKSPKEGPRRQETPWRNLWGHQRDKLAESLQLHRVDSGTRLWAELRRVVQHCKSKLFLSLFLPLKLIEMFICPTSQFKDTVLRINSSLASKDRINTSDISTWEKFNNNTYSFLPTRPAVSFWLSKSFAFSLPFCAHERKSPRNAFSYLWRNWRWSMEIDWFMLLDSRVDFIILHNFRGRGACKHKLHGCNLSFHAKKALRRFLCKFYLPKPRRRLSKVDSLKMRLGSFKMSMVVAKVELWSSLKFFGLLVIDKSWLNCFMSLNKSNTISQRKVSRNPFPVAQLSSANLRDRCAL